MAIMTDGIALTIVVLYYIIYTSKVINKLLIILQNKNSSEEYEMKSKLMKRMLSIALATLIATVGLVPAATVFAGDGVEGYYDLQIFYSDTNTIVPTYEEDGETEFKHYLVEGETLQLKYTIIDGSMPNNGYVKWYSEAPELVDVDQTGKVKGFDSSKGAVIKAWLNNEVRPTPIVGTIMATIIEKALFNEYVDLDTMDTEAICDLVIAALGSESILADYIEAYQGELVDSLRKYLDNINSDIHCQLYDGTGTLVADDEVHFVVTKNEEWYAAFLPNGTHITNKGAIPTTQATGNEVQLYALTTPQRLNFGTQYSVKSTSIFSTGKVVATVSDGGLVKFKNKGEVTIMASPDSEQVIQKILEMVNYFYKLENTGTLNTDKIAKVLIEYMGLDMNRAVLAGILDACFAIYQIVGNTADPVQLTATAAEVLANLVLQMAYNDSITFTVVDSQPITAFDIEGITTVKEGAMTQLTIGNMEPSTGNKSDVVWSSSDPTIASVDEHGVVTGLDAGGSLGELSKQTVTITAVSTTNNVIRTVEVTVTGKTGKYLSAVDINGKKIVGIGAEADYTYTVYPQRVADSENLYITWGMQTGVDEDNNPVYEWAEEGKPVTDGVGTINAKGHYVAVGGGNSTIAVQARTGYYLSDGSFYEISSKIATKDILTGIAVDSIDIAVTGATGSGASLDTHNTITIAGKDYEYYTVNTGVGEAYYQRGAVVTANVYPADATDPTLTWVCDNSNFSVEVSEDTHTITISHKAGNEIAETFNLYALSSDGDVKSNVITVCVTRNTAIDNKIDQDSITLINGKDAEATHTMSFKGSWTGTAYACYNANWYSSDEEVFSVSGKGNENSDAVIHANDVGTATLYCVSADGGITARCTVTVKPDKSRLKSIINLCEKTIVLQTPENKADYKKYMKKLDLAYSVYYEQDMASQLTVDTYADALLQAFIKVGGFVGISRVDVRGTNDTVLKNNRVTVSVGSTTNYKNYSYDFNYDAFPASAMYSSVEWTSSTGDIAVDKNGVCTPTVNDPCTAVITCTITDYSGNKVSDSATVSFARTQATGVTLDTTDIPLGKIGETATLTPTVSPVNVLGNSTASVQNVEWYSTNPAIASVDNNGVVTFNYGGDCVIVCTTADGGYTAECTVHVVTNYSKLQLLVNQYTDLNLNKDSYYPETWEVYEQAMADATDMLSHRTYTQVQVDDMYNRLESAFNGLKKYVFIKNVELYLDGEATSEFYQYDLSLLKDGLSYKNAVLDLNVRLYPNNATYTAVRWESSTDAISVTTDGKCSPTSNKSCYGSITCTVVDHFGQEFTDSVWVSFSYYPVTGVILSEDSISGEIGTTYKLNVTIEPTGTSLTHVGAAAIQDYYWESDDPNIATVDENGVVTFRSAGSTFVRCVSYDGGISGQCAVSSAGDRTALKAALSQYKDVDYTQYQYEYAMAFVSAYADAQDVLTDMTKTQDQIDEATEQLTSAGEALLAHPNIAVENIAISYTTTKKPLTGSSSTVATGTVAGNNALSVNLDDGNYSNYNNYNWVVLTPSAQPSNAMYKSIEWRVDAVSNMDTAVNGDSVQLTPKKKASAGYARVTVITTDYFDRTVSRTVDVVLADVTCTGLNVTDTNITMLATDAPRQIDYSVEGEPDLDTVEFVSSNPNVVTVTGTGVLTPVDKGSATVTATTLDGGYSKKIFVEVQTDFSVLASKVKTYGDHLNSIADYTYTEDTLSVLTQEIADSDVIVKEGKATQAEVNQHIAAIDAAYAGLIKYVPTTGVDITYQKSDNITTPNPGYIRYTGAALNNCEIVLKANELPAQSVYTDIKWESDNENITVSNRGVVTNNTANAGVARITCTVTNINDETYSKTVNVSFVRFGVTGVTFEDEMIFGAPAEVKSVKVNLGLSSLAVTGTCVKDCIYTSSDESVATVDESGNVTFLTQGTSVITVTAKDGGYVGTINAYTTWDTGALQEAIAQAELITYTDYEYQYGTAFNNAYLAAKDVYANVYATQDEINEACTNLQEAMTDLEGHPFIPAKITFKTGSITLIKDNAYAVDANNQINVRYVVNADAMYKSITLSILDNPDATYSASGNSMTITRNTDSNLKVTVMATVVDTYDRETVTWLPINLVDNVINISSIGLTCDGTAVEGTVTKTGYNLTYSDFDGIQMGYVTNPANATEPTSVKWTSSASEYVTIDSNGKVALTLKGRAKAINVSNITCTVTNNDGSTVTCGIQLVISRRESV